MIQMKRRDFALELKADEFGADGSFTGYGSVFGVVDSYQEIVAPRAFKKSLVELKRSNQPLPALWQHDSHSPIGIYTALSEDETGLRVEGKLLIDEVGQAREAFALMKAGAVTGLSIGYWTRKSSYDEVTGIRTLQELDLREISLVTFPACEPARVDAVKSRLSHGELPTMPEFEDFLREAGFSKSQAAAIAGKGLSHLLRGEPGREPTADFWSALQAEMTA